MISRAQNPAFLVGIAPTLLAIIVNSGCGGPEALSPGMGAETAVSDAGNKVDGAVPDASEGSARLCSSTLPIPTTPCFSCDPLPPGEDGGCGGPLPPLWGWDGGGVPDGRRYPVGCEVALPFASPYYPQSGAQPCYCSNSGGASTGPVWACPM